MTKRVILAGLLAPAIFLCALACARAGETTVGVTLDATIDTHAEARSSSALPVVPVPIFSIEHREGRFALYLEGVPPIGPVGVDSGDATKLSMFDGSLRFAVTPQVWVGLGETIFNQKTYYPLDETQASRVVGARYSAGTRLWQSGAHRIDLEIHVSPSMRGTIITTIVCCSGALIYDVHDAERASLVDAQARWSLTRGKTVLSAGLRWINYAAVFAASGSIADQNRIVSPFIGWSTKL